MKRVVEYGQGKITHDHIFATKLLQNASMRPIHDQIMHTEATRMAQLCYIVKKLGVPQRCIKDIKTDALIMQGFPKKCRPNLIALAEHTNFTNLPSLRRKFEKALNQRFMDDNDVFPEGCSSSECVFRHELGEKVKRLEGNYKTPCRQAEPPVELQAWRDLNGNHNGKTVKGEVVDDLTEKFG